MTETSTQNETGRVSSWLPWARLVRLPAVPTAASNILAAYLLAFGNWSHVSDVLLLCASSCLLYASGMVLNDYCDFERDKLHAAYRPLPSGRIAKPAALGLYFVLTLLGVALPLAVSVASTCVACAIVVAIYCYSFVLKTTVLAAPLMGLCRSLNALLGVSPIVSGGGNVGFEVWCYAIGLGLFICGLTIFARDERGTVSRDKLIFGGGMMALGLVGLGWLAAIHGFSPGYPIWRANLNCLAIVAVTIPIVFRTAIAIRSCEGPDVQRAVKTTIRSLILLDAAICLACGHSVIYGLLVLAMLLPVIIFARAISTT